MALNKSAALEVLKDDPNAQYCVDCWASKARITAAEDKNALLVLGDAFGTGAPYAQTIGACQECGEASKVYGFISN